MALLTLLNKMRYAHGYNNLHPFYQDQNLPKLAFILAASLIKHACRYKNDGVNFKATFLLD